MVMNDQPDAVDEAEARCPTYPVLNVTVVHREVDVVEAMSDRQLVAHHHLQVTHLVGDRAGKSREDSLPSLPLAVRAEISQGWREIERNDVGRIQGHDALDVFRAT